MRHFDISDWADFARGTATDANRGAMEAHLTAGCRRCNAILAFVKRVVSATRADSLYSPPESVVRCAKAIGTMLRPQRVPVSRLLGRLVYDSFRDPAPVGLRAEDRVSRHTTHEAGSFSVDLRFEHMKGSPVATLVGQLINRQEPEGTMAGAPVMLMSSKDIIAHTVYNRFGEFQMDYTPSRNLRLFVDVSPGKRLELSLGRLADDSTQTSDAAPPRRKQSRPGRTTRSRK
jgi:hypothetical protein